MKETFRVPVRVQVGHFAIEDTIAVEIDIAAAMLDGNEMLNYLKRGSLAAPSQSDLLEALSANDTARLLRLLADKLDTARLEK